MTAEFRSFNILATKGMRRVAQAVSPCDLSGYAVFFSTPSDRQIIAIRSSVMRCRLSASDEARLFRRWL